MLEAIPKVDRIVVLGDIVGYGPDPNAVIERLRSVRARAVMGNHDAAMLDPGVLDWFNPHAAAAARWTQGVLTAQSRHYLASLPKLGRIGRHRCVGQQTEQNVGHQIQVSRERSFHALGTGPAAPPRQKISAMTPRRVWRPCWWLHA